MLEQILDYIHNYFEKDIVSGLFVISDGKPLVNFLQEGQYFRVCGSVFNNGVHQYSVDDLVDETFDGQIWAMAVPPAVINLSEEVSEWVDKYSGITNSPYQSESFGGYSYTKSTGGSGGGAYDWRSVFGSRLNHWRKIS